MWRHLVLAGIVYLCGHPTFDGSRPAVLDRPLQSFYYAVNEAAIQGEQGLASLNETRARYLQAFLQRMHRQIDDVRAGK